MKPIEVEKKQDDESWEGNDGKMRNSLSRNTFCPTGPDDRVSDEYEGKRSNNNEVLIFDPNNSVNGGGLILICKRLEEERIGGG